MQRSGSRGVRSASAWIGWECTKPIVRSVLHGSVLRYRVVRACVRARTAILRERKEWASA
jgi:hypothetical protein